MKKMEQMHPFSPSMSPDFLVIGAGVAGLRAAIELAEAGQVLVIAKDTLRESSSEYAQGGIAVALSDDDEGKASRPCVQKATSIWRGLRMFSQSVRSMVPTASASFLPDIDDAAPCLRMRRCSGLGIDVVSAERYSAADRSSLM